MEVGEGQELLESCDAGEPPGPRLGVRRPKSPLGVNPKRRPPPVQGSPIFGCTQLQGCPVSLSRHHGVLTRRGAEETTS